MTALCGNTRGSTAIEYALIGSLIGLVIVAVLGQIGSQVNAMLARVVF